jgi:hypothetical protein
MRRLAVVLCAASVLGASACTGGSIDEVAPTTGPTTVAAQAPSTDVEPPVTGPPTTTPPVIADPLASNTGEGAKTLGALEGNDLEIDTEFGTVQIGNADVPDGLDERFPLPDDLAVELATETPTDLGFSATSSLTLAELADFYSTELPKAGYEISSTQEVEGTLVVFGFDGLDRAGQIVISQSPGGETRTIVVALGDGTGEKENVPD